MGSLDVLTHLAGGLEIRVRHELAPYRRDLIHALGASYVVDPTAPPCAGRCGRKVCSVPNNHGLRTNVEIDRRVNAIIERETGGPVVERITARCGFCPAWEFTGPVEQARKAQASHREAVHGGRATTNGGTMGTKTCAVCRNEVAPTHGRYAGIGADCRAKGYHRKHGEIVGPTAEPESRPAPKPPDLPANANGSSDGLDLIDQLREIATDEQIAHHDREAERHKAASELLRSIREQIEVLAA